MTHVTDEKLIVIAEMTVKKGRIDAFLNYALDNLSISREYPGNIEFDILVDETKPGQVIFYEVWESAEAQQAYMAWRIEAGDLTTLTAFLASAPNFTALRLIAADPYTDR